VMQDYYSVQAVNISSLKHMRRSPMHYLEVVANQRKDTRALALGRVAHMAVLEPERFDRAAVVTRMSRTTRAWELLEQLSSTGEVPVLYDGGARRGKAWDAFARDHEGCTIVLASEWAEIEPVLERTMAGAVLISEQEYEQASRVAAAVHAHPRAHELLLAGQAEVPMYWADAETGIDCKGRPDYVSPAALVDLKLTRNIESRPFFAQQYGLGTHLQISFYYDGLDAIGRHVDEAYVIAAENVRPYDVAVYRVPSDLIAFGRDEYRWLLRRLRECVETDTWPGTCPDVSDYEIPAWAWEGAPGDVELDFTGVDGAEAA